MTLSVTIIAAAGCGGGGGEVSQQQSALDRALENWSDTATAHYRFESFRTCYCIDDYTKAMLIEVEDGAIVDATYVESGEPVPENIRAELPTIEDLFEMIQDALDESAYMVTVTYDPRYGYPADLYIDRDQAIADEELGVTITNFEELDM